MSKSEKAATQQMSESTSSESLNSSMIANLSIESILSSHETAELNVEFSKAGTAVACRKGVKRAMESKEIGVKKKDSKVHISLLSREERVHVLNGRTLLCILYCALNICGSKIQLTDLLRFAIEGRISFYNNRLHLPEDFKDMKVPLSHDEHHTYRLVTYESIRKDISFFVQAIPDLTSSLMTPNLLELCSRYLRDMGLPLEILGCIERLINFNPPRFSIGGHKFYLQNYEGRAMAYIIFVLKLIFGLDGHREEEMSVSARNVNETLEKIGAARKIFVYKDWMEFIEYRQAILGPHYHPLLFSLVPTGQKTYVSFKSMIDALNQKPRKVETSKVANNKPRMTSKINAQKLLKKLIKKRKKCILIKREYTAPSFTPLHDTFQQLLRRELTEINRKIGSQDFSEAAFDYFLEPPKLFKTCADAGIEIVTMKSRFPSSYVFYRVQKVGKMLRKEVFKLSLNQVTEDDWRADMGKRNALERKADSKKKVEYHEKTNEWVLAKRKIWRGLINEKKKESRPQNDLDESKSSEPLTFHEETIFTSSDLEIEDTENDEIERDASMEAQLEEVFKTSERLAKIQDKTSLTFVVPDYNLWHCLIRVKENFPNNFEEQIEMLPQNFLWLLKFCASILHQTPSLLYLQLQCIESQFVNVYAPIELMDNTMVKQKEKMKSKFLSNKYRLPW